MSREKSNERRARVGADLKAMFDAKAGEPVPERLLDLVDDLDAPPKVKAG